ncbi:ClbS/DfsB family four-helix bundle protein [Pleomorphomonas sp. PLEO]|uniref:ClbS/DfsB family four-helix bundle protein n=1 Tax=Pleomorphomonas sp. PLEO TaxID=3239306 RepID=UPI00351DBD6F
MIPANKTELTDAIRVNYLKLRADLDSVPEALSGDPTLEGHVKGTRMSVHDLVAYLVGWCELVLKWHAGKIAGEPVDFPDTGYKWSELGRLAQKFYADYADLSYQALLDRFAADKDRILDVIAETENDDLYGKPWYEAYTFGRMIQLNTSSPFDNARKRLRRWKKEKGLP